MSPLPALIVRPALPADLAGVAAMVARVNASPAGQSLHCAAETASAVRAALRRTEDFHGGWHQNFVLAVTADGEPAAVLGCQLSHDQALGWLWGPWMADDRLWRSSVAVEGLETLARQLPATTSRLEAFLHVENQDAICFLQSRGFSTGPATHIYTSWPAGSGNESADIHDLGIAHEVAFARLHADTFPAHGSAPAAELLADRGNDRRIFAATDGLRLLGYVCVSVNRAPLEGFVDYLAVRPSAQGQGIGAALLRRTRHWTFTERRLPQLSLCVSDWRAGARRLYEQTGFRLAASGVAVRRKLQSWPRA